MDYTLFDGYLDPRNTDCLSLSFNFDQVDGQFFLELHLLIRCDKINLSLQLTHNAVCIGDTPGGGFSCSIG